MSDDYSDTTVIIPVKDEPAVGSVVDGVTRMLKDSKIIVIYAGSNKPDITTKSNNLTILKQTDIGKGSAVLQAAKIVKTPILCLIDGDATYDPADLKTVVKMVRNSADLAVGDRLSRINDDVMPKFIQFGNKVITGTANLLYGLRLKDSQTGLRAVKKSVFDGLGLKEPYFGIETEMNVKARKGNCKIEETPISYHKRIGSSKQVKLFDGIKLLLLDFKFIFE